MGSYESQAAAKYEAQLARFNQLLEEKHDTIMQKSDGRQRASYLPQSMEGDILSMCVE